MPETKGHAYLGVSLAHLMMKMVKEVSIVSMIDWRLAFKVFHFTWDRPSFQHLNQIGPIPAT